MLPRILGRNVQRQCLWSRWSNSALCTSKSPRPYSRSNSQAVARDIEHQSITRGSGDIVENQKDYRVSHTTTAKPDCLHDILQTEHLRDVDEYDWTQLIKHLKTLRQTSKKYDEILDIGQQILSKGFDVKRTVYEELMYTLEEHHPTDQHCQLAIELMLKYMDQGYLNSGNSLRMVQLLFKIIVSSGNPVLKYRYWQITNSAPLPTTKKTVTSVYENLALLYISTGELENVISILKETAEQGNSLSQHLNEVVFLALIESGDIEFAWEMMNRLLKMRAVYSRTWGLFVSHAAKLGHYPALEWAFKTAVIPGSVVLDDWCYERMIDIGSRNGDYGMVRWSFLRGKKRKDASKTTPAVSPVANRYYIALIEAHARAGEIGPAFELIERMGEGAEVIQLRDLPQLVEMISANKEYLSTAADLFIKMGDNPTISDACKTVLFNVICRAIGSLDWNAQLSFYRECQLKMEVVPNEDTFITLIRSIGPHSDPLLIQEIHQDCDKFGITKSHRIYGAIVEALRAAGYCDSADRYLEEMRTNNLHISEYLAGSTV